MDKKYLQAIINFAKEFECNNFPVDIVIGYIVEAAEASDKSISEYLDRFVHED